MNLDELRSIRNRERNTDSLQHLQDSFYEKVGRYIADLKAERERVAEQADDQWSNPEIQRLSDEIDTAEEIAEAIYERRMGKLVKEASLAAAGYATDAEGLTLEEERLFEDLVTRIETNKGSVLDVLSGESSGTGGQAQGEPSTETNSQTPTSSTGEHLETATEATAQAGDSPRSEEAASPSAAAPAELDPVESGDTKTTADGGGKRIDAAAVMDPDPDSDPAPAGNQPDVSVDASSESAPDGDDDLGTDPLVADTDPAPDAPTPPDADAHPPDVEASATPTATDETNASDPAGADKEASEHPDSRTGTDPEETSAETRESTERTTVRITSDIGEILGIDEHEYHLTSDDVVTLPDENATPLIERDAAEPLE
jgi:DNA replication factor GINS